MKFVRKTLKIARNIVEAKYKSISSSKRILNKLSHFSSVDFAIFVWVKAVENGFSESVLWIVVNFHIECLLEEFLGLLEF